MLENEVKVKVAVVDHEDSYRKKLVSVFERCASVRVVYESDSSASLCETLVYCSPDVLVLDVSPPGAGGLSTLHAIRSNPATADQTVAILSSHGRADFVSEAIGPGKADAYITKDESPEKIAAYIQALKQNKSLILSVGRGPEPDNGEKPTFYGVKGLSKGQLLVADMLNEGLKPRNISTRTGASIATVYRHIHNIKEAIGFRDYKGVLLFQAYLRQYLKSCRTE
ncbi:MAG: response regulator transcription factor [Leptospirales bacterium]